MQSLSHFAPTLQAYLPSKTGRIVERSFNRAFGHIKRCTLAVWLLCAGAVPAAAPVAAQTPETTLDTVTVIGTTPLPGVGQSREEIAAPVQAVKKDEIKRSGALELGELMERQLGSVHVNAIQGNPYQLDVNYRGYTASPLLGTPQGLSVYVDGVRMNQPFGDVVNWDLIPKNAIANMSMMPGSNPLFGLNTLGGALNVQTKDGRKDAGTEIQAGFGSFGRRSVEIEHGGHNDKGLDWFVASNWAFEEGWRDASKTEVRQLFGKLGWQDSRTRVSLATSYADNTMNGNGLQEYQLLNKNYESVYTQPDETKNRGFSLNLTGRHELTDGLLLGGNAYYRYLKTRTVNSDINEGSLDQSVYQPNAADRAALAGAGYRGYPNSGANASNTPFPYWRCLAQALQNDEPAEKCTGLINRTETTQSNYGVQGQLTWLQEGKTWRNQAVVGGGYDAARMRYQQTTQLGYVNADHTVTGVNAFADGVTGGDVDGAPYDNRVNLTGRSQTWSAFASNTFSLQDRVHLTLAGRYNTTQVNNRDQINPGGGANSLDGDHRFSRFNPAVGLTAQATPWLNVYGGYNQSSRAPTAIELGCANPDQPCKLPNAMAGDPPLKQVVTHTFELGARGQIPALGKTFWHAGVFRADNYDDILFVADNQTGYGYFKNFGKTRRQGLELSLSTQQRTWGLGGHYTLLDATFQSAEVVNGSSNSSNDAAIRGTDGNIQINPGNVIPLMPRHQFKLFGHIKPLPELMVGGSMVAVSSSYVRGNENNAHQADGQYYQGSGKVPGYAIFNLSLDYQLAKSWHVIAQVNNLFDKRYATAGQLGAMAFNSNGGIAARPFGNVGGEYPIMHSTFYSPGAPRSFWLGLRYAYDAPKN